MNRSLTTRCLTTICLTLPIHAQQVLLQIPGTGEKGFGLTAAFVDDLTCDGVPEILIGGDASMVHLYDGGSGTLINTFAGQQSDDLYGVRVVCLGDVTGDGMDEIAIGSRDAYNGIPVIDVFSAVDGVLVWSLDIAGWGMARIADLDGDGFPELGVCDEDKSYVFSGATGAQIFSADRNPALTRLNEIADAGDLDGDGITDIITGNLGWTNTGPGEALVRSGADYSVIHTFTGDFNSDLFGGVLAGRGEVDGDGVHDQIVGAWYWNGGQAYCRIHSGTNGSLIRSFPVDAAHPLAGRVTAGYIGDLDHDGRDDYVVAAGSKNALGRITAYSGASGAVLAQHDGVHVGDGYGHALCTTHDFDGDGHKDALVGVEPGFDAAQRYVQVVSLSSDPSHTYCTSTPNSSGAAARLRFEGSTQLHDAELTLRAHFLPAHQFGYFLASQSQAYVPNFGGSAGILCLGPPIFRFNKPGQIQNSGSCGIMELSVDFSNLPNGVTFLPGNTWYFQAWFRDLPAATSNTTQGVEVLFR